MMRSVPSLSTLGLLALTQAGCRPDPGIFSLKVDPPLQVDEGSADPAWEDDSGNPEDSGIENSNEVVVAIPAPTLDADGVAAAIQSTLAGGLPSPMRAREAYLAMFEGRDERCPGGSQPSLPGRFEGCWSESDWFYAGYAEYGGSDDPLDTSDDFTLLADGQMIDGSGGSFIGAGELYYDAELGSQRWEGGLTGTWSYDLASDWMGVPAAGGVLTFLADVSGSHWRLEVDGSVAGGDHPIALQDVVVEADDCGATTSGAVRLRGGTGYWYTLALEDCGCGTVTYDDGTILGEGCIDLATAARPLAEWRL